MCKLFYFFIALTALLLITPSTDAQSTLLLNYSLSIEPTVGNRLISYKGNYPQSFKDSIQKVDRSRDAISMAFMVSTKFKSRN